MSMWTHIVASIDVDTFIESDTIKEDVEKMLEKAPKITGSEGPADVFVNVRSGSNISSEDGNHDYQTLVAITVIGDLRDREKHQTEKEWETFKDFIGIEPEFYSDDRDGLNFEIRNCSCESKG